MKVWREGDRIRQEDGSGYGDVVPDGDIWHHLASAEVTLRWPDGYGADELRRAREQAEFCKAVLALRQTEREQAARGSEG